MTDLAVFLLVAGALCMSVLLAAAWAVRRRYTVVPGYRPGQLADAMAGEPVTEQFAQARDTEVLPRLAPAPAQVHDVQPLDVIEGRWLCRDCGKAFTAARLGFIRCPWDRSS